MTGEATTHSVGSTRGMRASKLALLGGFVALTLAVAIAHRNPATGYELSIYRASPVAFWVGVGAAMAAALAVSLAAVSRRLRTGALVLGGAAVLSVVGLPILRGYYFYGTGDALSHLGYARAFVSGAGSPLNLLHPGVHLVAIAVGGASGTGLEWASMFAVVVFFATFLAFVPLCARAIAGTELAGTVGLFSAALLLPINSVSVHSEIHPTSEAILFVPFVLFLVLSYVTHGDADGRLLSFRPVGVLLSLASVAVVLLHPQQALNVVLILGTIAGVQFLVRRYRPGHPFARHRRIYVQAAFSALVFAVWVPRSERFQGAWRSVLDGLIGPSTPGDEIAGRSASLVDLGGSLPELFLKLFLTSTVVSVVAGLFMLASLSGRLDDRGPERDSLVSYLALGLLPVVGLFLAFFVASETTQPFRYTGFVMAINTVVAAVAVAYLVVRLDRPSLPRGTLRVGIAVFFVLALPLSMATIHSSPYIYQDSSQVTEDRMAGHVTAFAIRDPEIAWVGIRGNAQRFVDAVYGSGTPAAESFPNEGESVSPAVFNAANYTDAYDGERYLVVERSDVAREVRLYRGFRFSQRGFRSLNTTTGVSRVHSNGAVSLYLVDGNETAPA